MNRLALLTRASRRVRAFRLERVLGEIVEEGLAGVAMRGEVISALPLDEDLCSIGRDSRSAISLMVSSTGRKSLGDREMTARTSLIALWYSRLSSNSADFAST